MLSPMLYDFSLRNSQFVFYIYLSGINLSAELRAPWGIEAMPAINDKDMLNDVHKDKIKGDYDKCILSSS